MSAGFEFKPFVSRRSGLKRPGVVLALFKRGAAITVSRKYDPGERAALVPRCCSRWNLQVSAPPGAFMLWLIVPFYLFVPKSAWFLSSFNQLQSEIRSSLFFFVTSERRRDATKFRKNVSSSWSLY